jgi:hypothetical protein
MSFKPDRRRETASMGHLTMIFGLLRRKIMRQDLPHLSSIRKSMRPHKGGMMSIRDPLRSLFRARKVGDLV